jgi:hypothetical protein
MKKVLALFLAIVACINFLGCGLPPVYAQENPETIFTAFPELKQGVLFNIEDSTFSYLSTIRVMSWKKVSLEAGYSSKDSLVAVISYPIIKLKDLGVDVPIVNLIEFNIGFGAGWKRLTGSNEFTYGPTITLFNVKF